MSDLEKRYENLQDYTKNLPSESSVFIRFAEGSTYEWKFTVKDIKDLIGNRKIAGETLIAASPQWEYLVTIIAGKDKDIKMFDLLGSSRWELVSIIGNRAYFKRLL